MSLPILKKMTTSDIIFLILFIVGSVNILWIIGCAVSRPVNVNANAPIVPSNEADNSLPMCEYMVNGMTLVYFCQEKK